MWVLWSSYYQDCFDSFRLFVFVYKFRFNQFCCCWLFDSRSHVALFKLNFKIFWTQLPKCLHCRHAHMQVIPPNPPHPTGVWTQGFVHSSQLSAIELSSCVFGSQYSKNKAPVISYRDWVEYVVAPATWSKTELVFCFMAWDLRPC